MKSIFKPLLLAGLLATAGFAALSQAPAGPMMGASAPMKHEGMRHHERMGRMDPAKMQARMDQRNGELKAQLKITAAQESAWTSYTEAMKPPAGLMDHKRPDRAQLEKLPTPERIDTLKALRSRHMADMNAAMDQRGEATKAFYAALTPEQQKVFDTNAMRRHGRDGRMGGMRHGQGPAATPPAAN
jgi:Spy/CpxP family protein refolding chaperone